MSKKKSKQQKGKKILPRLGQTLDQDDS